MPACGNSAINFSARICVVHFPSFLNDDKSLTDVWESQRRYHDPSRRPKGIASLNSVTPRGNQQDAPARHHGGDFRRANRRSAIGDRKTNQNSTVVRIAAINQHANSWTSQNA